MIDLQKAGARMRLVIGYGCLFPLLLCSAPSMALANPEQNVTFSDRFLRLANPTSVDLSRYINGVNIAPGTYSAEVNVNGTSLGSMDIELRERKDKTVFPLLNGKSHTEAIHPEE
jgi:outer membrane usher protein